MDEYTEQEKINPKAMKLEIGIRSFRTIIIYPLSLGDQFKMSKIIAEGVSEFFQREDKTDVDLVSFGITRIGDHLKEILGYVLDEDEDPQKVIDEIDNDQVVELANLIYIMNFEGSIKNAKSLFEKVRVNLSLSERPLPQSVKDMDSDLETSITDGLKMEDTQEIS